MANISAQVGGWKATATVPTPADIQEIDKLVMAIHAIDRERALLRTLRLDGMSDEEYLTREAVIDELLAKYKELFEGHVPAVVWEEV